MKVGDYVRFKTLSREIKIGKVIEIIEPDKESMKKYCVYDLDNNEVTVDDYVIKSNPNIIDLFEEHDLVVIEYYSLRYNERVTRLFEVDYKDKEFMTLKNAYCDFMLRNNKFNDEDKKLKPIIKSILTHEQFESMEYKVGELV